MSPVGRAPREGAVAAWIRVRLPVPDEPAVLAGPPPPPDPPLEDLQPEPVPTDPRRRFFSAYRETPIGLIRLSWDADDPTLLDAELRIPTRGGQLAPAEVERFWDEIRRWTAPLGRLTVEAADPSRSTPRGRS